MSTKDKSLNSGRKSTSSASFAVIGTTAALLASTCCVLPLTLILLGITGAWIGNLSALEPYRAYFIAVAAISIGIGFYKVYTKPTSLSCDPDSYCAKPYSEKITKTILWIAAFLVILSALWPYVVPIIFKNN